MELPPPDLNPWGEGDEGINRYSAETVQQAADVIDRDLARARRDADVQLAEHHSQRGTVGSSIESWSQQEMLTNLETERMRRLTDLQIAMANAFAEDRVAAAQIGLSQRAQQLTALGMDRQEALARAQMEQQESQFGRSLGQQESQFARTYSLNQQALAVETQRIQAEQALQGRQIDLGYAQLEAEVNLRTQQLMQQAEQFGQSMSLEQARLQAQQEQFGQTLEFQRYSLAQEMGFSYAQLEQQNQQFLADLADRNTQRLHEWNILESTQAFQSSENAMNRLLESRALDLQRDQFNEELGFRQQALSAEAAWRQADRDLELLLATRAETFTREGWAREDAYRQAIIDLDRETLEFQRQSQDQNARLAAWDVWLRALEQLGPGADVPDFTTYPTPTG